MQTAVDTARYVAELHRALNNLSHERIDDLVALLVRAAHEGRKIFIIGNGGSAATASHFACDLAKGTQSPLKPRCRVIALTDNVPLITAWGNDANYADIFAEQLRTLCDPEDILIAISASGRSANILRAATVARETGATVVGMTGGGGLLGLMSDLWIETPADCIEQIEDLHLIVEHLVCCQVRERL